MYVPNKQTLQLENVPESNIYVYIDRNRWQVRYNHVESSQFEI